MKNSIPNSKLSGNIIISSILILFIFINVIIYYFQFENNLSRKYKTAQEFFQKGDQINCKHLFLEIHQTKKDYLNTNFYLGKLYFYEKDFRKASEFFHQSWILQKEIHFLEWFLKSQIYSGSPNKDLLKYLDLYISLNPENQEILFWKGFFEQKEGNLSSAIYHYEKVIQNTRFPQKSASRLKDIYLDAGIISKYNRYKKLEKSLENLK